MAEAVGILEVFGLATAFVAGDAGCKAANVRLEVFDKNKPANADAAGILQPVGRIIAPVDYLIPSAVFRLECKQRF